MRTVELLPDPTLDAAVRRSWRRLHEAGLPSLATHRHPTNRPHLTLAEADDLAPEALGEVAAVLAGALPLPVVAASLGMFVHRGLVLHLALVPSPALVELHARVLDALDRLDAAPREHVRPGAWVPHLTLASRLPRDDLAAAVDVVGDALPVSGLLVGARTYDTTSRTVASLVP